MSRTVSRTTARSVLRVVGAAAASGALALGAAASAGHAATTGASGWALTPIGPLPFAEEGAEPRDVFEALDGAGTGLIGWSRGDVLSTEGSVIAQVRGGRSLGRSARIKSSVRAIQPAPGGGAVAVLEPPPSRPGRAPYGLRWSVLRASGGEAEGGVLTKRFAETAPALSVNGRGDAVVAWMESANDFDPPRIKVAVRRAGHAFGRTVELGQMDGLDQAHDEWQIGSLDAVVSPSGHVLVAYAGRLRSAPSAAGLPPLQVLTWTARVGGDLTGPIPIGRSTVPTAMRAAFDGRGRGYVVWTRPQPRGRAQLATWTPGAPRFSRPRSLETRPTEGVEDAHVGIASYPAGGAVLTWQRPGEPGLYASITDRSGRPGAPTQITSDKPLPWQVAAGPGRSALLSWHADRAGALTDVVAISRRGGRFGAPSPTGLAFAAPYSFGDDGQPRGLAIRGTASAAPELVFARLGR